MPESNNTSVFASLRIERIIGRVFSLAAFATSLETITNASGQIVFLKPEIIYISIGLIMAAQLVSIYNFWFGDASRLGYVLQAGAYFVSFVLYPFSITHRELFPHDYRPWLWWATGTAAMAGGMFLFRKLSIAWLVFTSASWFWLRLQPIGGSATLERAALDAIYIVLFAAVVLTMVGMMRSAAYAQDRASDEASLIASKTAAADAAETERSKLDDLVHDQVLTTLILAAKANNSTQEKLAAESAEGAIARLQELAQTDSNQNGDLAAGAFLEAIQKTVLRMEPECEISIALENEVTIPLGVAFALTDATIQAFRNSQQHSGKNALREVRLKTTPTGVKIVVKDNGKGFWESKIPKDRLGVRNSIRRRVSQVGGEVKIESAPRKGATVVMWWEANA